MITAAGPLFFEKNTDQAGERRGYACDLSWDVGVLQTDNWEKIMACRLKEYKKNKMNGRKGEGFEAYE